MSDIQIRLLADALLGCLCTAVAANPNPPANCCFRVGTEVAHDMGQEEDLCCEGLAYVSLGDVFPSVASFPEQDIVRQVDGNCPPAAWNITFQLGIVRCVPVGDGNFPPSCEEWNASAIQGFHDAQALQAAACCFRRYVVNGDTFPGMSMVITRQSPGVVLGGCTERKLVVAAQVPNCETC